MVDAALTRARLWDVVAQFSPDELTRREAGGWTVLDVLEHLGRIEQGVARGMQHALSAAAHGSIPVHNLRRVVDRSIKIDAPERLRPTGVVHTLADARAFLEQADEQLRAVIASVSDPALWDTQGFEHPVFGLVRCGQWVDFVAYHEVRHILQLEEMYAAFRG